MRSFRLTLFSLRLVLGLILCLTACNTLESALSSNRFLPTPLPPTLSARAPTATASPPPTNTVTATAAPTVTLTPTAPPTPTASPTVSPTETIIMDEYNNIAAGALGFGDLGTPPPLPAPLTAALLPTVAPDELAGVAIPPQQIWRADKTQPRIALTFDTGQGTPVVRLILQELQLANVRATFFIVGNWAAKNGDVVRAIVAGRHDLGNHSYSHPNLTQLTDAQVLAQMMQTENIVHQETGCTTRPFFRAPFGASNNQVSQLIGQAGFINFAWTVHGGDWLPGATVDTIHQRVVQNTGNGAIIILHSSVPATAQAVPLIINDLRARGFQFVTLSELLTTDPAHPFRAPCK